MGEAIDAYADNDDMVIVFAAGNYGNEGTIANPATGKNVISVGAIRYCTDDNLHQPPSQFREIGGRASYSSQGPTSDDSRLKPEIVAPGGQHWYDYFYYKNGVVSNNNSSTEDDGYDNWPTNFWYTRISGTSMAAPHVTGVLAKMKEWAPELHSEIMKANLINTAIPIKANSSNGLAGYANTQVGYGLVNGFSITDYYSGESSRLLFAEGWINENDSPLYDDYSISVPASAKKLAVTLVYNDQEGEESDGDALIDDMDLILISPTGTTYTGWTYLPPDLNESPIEKMVIENPPSGNWTVRVQFTDSPGFNNLLIYAEQRYGLVAHAILKEPSLDLSISQNTITVSPNEHFILQPTVTNTGGYIATGVTIKVDGPPVFGGENDSTKYTDNLMFENALVSPQINMVAPSTPGIYILTVEANGINKEFDNSSYPKTVQVTVNVTSEVFCSTKIFLEGPYSNGVMDTILYLKSYLPLNQPYDGNPWNYPGSETVTTIPANVVDWVLFELRTGVAASTQISQRAVFLKSDGSLVDLDGISPVKFYDVSEGDYYLVVHHRNHLSVMSSTLVPLSNESISSYDFSTAISQYYGTGSAKEISPGVWGMHGGEGNYSGIITIADRDAAISERDAVGYNDRDYNLSGIVTISDANLSLLNRDAATEVP